MSTLNFSFQKLRELAPTLNKAADEAAKIVQDVENLLTKELSLGIEAEVRVNTINLSPHKTIYKKLAHCRVNGKFRIAIVQEIRTEFTDENGQPEYSWQPGEGGVVAWAEAPRDAKLETFPLLPKLLQVILQKVEATKAEVEKTQATLREIIGDRVVPR
jgi:hypothetical protein